MRLAADVTATMPEDVDPTLLIHDATRSIAAFSALTHAQVAGVAAEAKAKLVHAAHDLLQRLEGPEDAIFRVAFGVR